MTSCLRQNRLLLAVCLPSVFMAACSPQAPTNEADVAAILALNERILGALNDGDWRRLNELTDDEYVSIINGAPVSGRERLEEANRRFLEQWVDEEAWLPDETVVEGDLAFQRGTFTMTLAPRQGDGEARELGGAYLHVYQRKPDGRWALTRAMAETAGN